MTRVAGFVVFSSIALCFIALPVANNNVDAARILAFFPAPSKSHLIIHCAVANVLQEAGHNVTVIAGMPNVYKNAKYNYINMNTSTFPSSFASQMVNKPVHIYKRLLSFLGYVSGLANGTLANPIMQQFMHDHQAGSYDLLLLGYFFNDFHLGLAQHFKCPVILSFMMQPIFFIDALVGNPSEIAYVPPLFSGLKQPLNFFNRVLNYMAASFEELVLKNLLRYYTLKYYSSNFPADRYVSYDEAKKNVSLIFTNHHFSQGPIRPYVPALVDIGGIQIKEQPDPLPADLASELDSAKQGAIFFSLGSNVQGSTLPKEKATIMYNVLSKLPYKVFWKWGDSDFPGTSANIIYKSWLPQNEILAHPNVKLFITHCGQGSAVESQYHGVPMVGMPLFADQPANAAHIKSAGFGLAVDYLTLTETDFRAAILEVIENPSYALAVQKFSKLYRDRPQTPRETVVFWTDYVLRHHGAKHLQSPAVHMNSLQLMSLDVIAFLLAVFAIVIFVFIKVCKLICCRSRKQTANSAHDTRKMKKTN